MPGASPRGALLLTMAIVAVVLCAALVLTLHYAKSSLAAARTDDPKPKAGPTGPFAARILALDANAYSATQKRIPDPAWMRLMAHNNEAGLYLDVVSDEVLFSSRHKLEPFFGYVEFSKPFTPGVVIEKAADAPKTAQAEKAAEAAPDPVPAAPNTELRSRAANSYLGWIATDAEGVRRFVINASALKFVPESELDTRGLGAHRGHFSQPVAP